MTTATTQPQPRPRSDRRTGLGPFARCGLLIVLVALMVGLFSSVAQAQEIPTFEKIIGRSDDPEDVTTTLEILFLLTILTLAPSIVIMTTSFTRIVIVLSFLRRALATQTLPPNQIIIGFALILSFFVMRPTLTKIKEDALLPYVEEEITQPEAWDITVEHMRTFMFQQVRTNDLWLFVEISGQDVPDDGVFDTDDDYAMIDTLTLIPAFVTSELRRSFEMGFILYLPFLIIDLLVASTLISMGMLVLPPIIISLPFKLLLFVLVDGWALLVGSLVKSFTPG